MKQTAAVGALTEIALHSSDYGRIVDAFHAQWGWETLGAPGLGAKVADWYCAKMMQSVTFGRLLIAPTGGTAGLAVGGVFGDRPVIGGDARLPERRAALEKEIAAQKGGPETIALYDHISRINEHLRRQTRENGRVFAAELYFLWVSPDYRGCGLSRRLLNAAMKAMKARRVKNFCLFTDTNCDWKFYMRDPWVACGRQPWPDVPGMRGGAGLMFGASL
ncbi:GNAT family N-acetyltransferase, partial [Mesosutterella sp. AGMB02718]|nr:GNAT family N-acetyltransferase [Mesosutterella sp. AGMB02718]MDL2060360.1 GNAT family N-acetyltransferase [Mesosutterella sp. AGMB02718]